MHAPHAPSRPCTCVPAPSLCPPLSPTALASIARVATHDAHTCTHHAHTCSPHARHPWTARLTASPHLTLYPPPTAGSGASRQSEKDEAKKDIKRFLAGVPSVFKYFARWVVLTKMKVHLQHSHPHPYPHPSYFSHDGFSLYVSPSPSPSPCRPRKSPRQHASWVQLSLTMQKTLQCSGPSLQHRSTCSTWRRTPSTSQRSRKWPSATAQRARCKLSLKKQAVREAGRTT